MVFIAIEYKDEYDNEDICILSKNLYGFELCNCCGECENYNETTGEFNI